LAKWGKRENFGNSVPKFNKNRREKEESWERKILNFGNAVTEFLCPNSPAWAQKKTNCGNAIAEIGKKKKKIFSSNCGNGIAEMGGEKKLNGIVAMSLRKWEEKKIVVAKIGEELKKKKCYIHNIFIILSQQITGD